MFDWLFEGRLSVYILLAVLAAGLLALWWNQRRGWPIVLAGIVLVLIGGYFLLDRLVETEREQVQRRLREIADGVRAGDTERVMAHVSQRFAILERFRDRAAFREYVESRLRGHLVDEVVIGDVVFPDGGTPAPDGTLRVHFTAKPKGAQLPPTLPSFLVEATFVRDADGQIRLSGFRVFNPFVNSDTPLDLP